MSRSDADRAVALRIAGGSYDAIGEQLGMSADEAEALVDAAIASKSNESASTAARLDLARLDALLLAVWKSAARGDSTAVTQALKITAQRAALLDRLGDTPADGTGSTSVADRLAAIKESAGGNPLAVVVEMEAGHVGSDGG